MKLRMIVWGGLLAMWLAPAVAMRLTPEVAWTGFDFLVWGAMLVLAGGGFEAAMRSSGSLAYRLGAGLAIVAAFLTVWSALAVGIVGDEGNPANLMFAGVLAVGLVGALAAKLKPAGMARTMWATAAAQGLVGGVAVLGGMEALPVMAAVTLVFGGLWLAAGGLFKRAARAWRLPPAASGSFRRPQPGRCRG